MIPSHSCTMSSAKSEVDQDFVPASLNSLSGGAPQSAGSSCLPVSEHAAYTPSVGTCVTHASSMTVITLRLLEAIPCGSDVRGLTLVVQHERRQWEGHLALCRLMVTDTVQG